VVPQPPKNLVTLPVIAGLSQDRQAPAAASSLAATPNTPHAGDAEAAEMRPPDPVSVSVAESQISATAVASPVQGPADERVPLDGEFGAAGTAGSVSAARGQPPLHGLHSRV